MEAHAEYEENVWYAWPAPREVLIKVLWWERFRPEIQPLTLLCTIFDGKYTPPFRITSIDNRYPLHISSLEPVADPGEGPDPPVFLDRTEARRAEKIFLGGGRPPRI